MNIKGFYFIVNEVKFGEMEGFSLVIGFFFVYDSFWDSGLFFFGRRIRELWVSEVITVLY